MKFCISFTGFYIKTRKYSTQKAKLNRPEKFVQLTMQENMLKLLLDKKQNEMISWSILNDENIHHFDWSDTSGQEVGLWYRHPFYNITIWKFKYFIHISRLIVENVVFSRSFLKSHSLAFLNGFDFSLSLDDFSFFMTHRNYSLAILHLGQSNLRTIILMEEKEDIPGPKNSRCYNNVIYKIIIF